MSIFNWKNKVLGYTYQGGGGKGGGGGGAPPPSSQTVTNTSIPEYARPYVERMIGKSEALTDINQNPYQAYGGERIASFSPLQEQAFARAAQQGPAGQLAPATQLATMAGEQALGVQPRAAMLGQEALGYGATGAQYGGLGAQEALARSQQAARQAAMYGRMGAGYGGRGVQAAEQGFGAGEAFARQATDPYAMQAYMSPYMQNVVDVQKQEAMRDYAKQIPGLQAQATRAGAFGGSRQAIEAAEARRNLGTQLGQIQATGTQKAFEDAQRQQQFGAQLGLQGLQAGYGGLGLGMQGAGLGLQGVGQQLGAGQLGLAGTGQGIAGAQAGLQGIQGALGAGQYGLQGLGAATGAAGTLGQLGQTQFGQEQAISAEQQKIGAVQQAQAQQALDLAYQDFLKQRNYPYQQLGFMSDMLRGLPLSQSAQTMYTAPPSLGSQLGGLGMAGLGIYGMSGGFRAKGGAIKEKKMAAGGYATGGDIKMLSTEQLEQLLESPSLSPMEQAMVEKQLMIRRRMEMNPEADTIMRGVAAIPTGNMVPMEEMAGGGIIAFAKGSKDAVEADDDPISNKQYREFLRSQVMGRLKNLESGPDPFAESKKMEADTRAQLAERRQTAPYEALAMAGLGTLAGTSQYGLSNLGLGAIQGMKTYGQAKAEESQMQKQLMQQGIEREKAKYGRDIQNLNALQTSLGQMDAREIAAMNQRTAQAGLAESRRTTAQINAQRTYDSAVKAEKDNLFKQNKAKYNMDYTDPDLEKSAIENVNKRLSPAMKSLLFPEGMPTLEAAQPAAPAAAPAKAPAKAPVKVKTIQERDALPSGTVYIDPNGVTRTKS